MAFPKNLNDAKLLLLVSKMALNDLKTLIE